MSQINYQNNSIDFKRVIKNIQRKVQKSRDYESPHHDDLSGDEYLNKLEFKKTLFKDKNLDISDKLKISQQYEKLLKRRKTAESTNSNSDAENLRHIIKKMVIHRKRRTRHDQIIRVSNLQEVNRLNANESAIHDNHSIFNLANPRTNESDFLCPKGLKHKSRNIMNQRRSIKSSFNSSINMIPEGKYFYRKY